MCLPVTPYKIEREWIHAGLSCAVVQAREAGHRCGYVRVPPGHPLHGGSYDLPDVDVHGGLTFAEMEPCVEHEDGQGWWFGFDCAHSGDRFWDPTADPILLSPEARRSLEFSRELDLQYPSSNRGDSYRDQAYVELECERLAEQLAAL